MVIIFKKYLFIILLVCSILYLKAEEIIIYSTESAQYSADDCCTLNIITNQNGDELDSRSCFNTANYGCMQSKSAPIWIFDLIGTWLGQGLYFWDLRGLEL